MIIKTTLNLYEAKTNLSELVERAAAGEEITIAKAGKPMARLGPLPAAKRERKPGLLKGKIWVRDDFDDPLPPDVLAAFYGPIEPSDSSEETDEESGA